MNEHLRSDPHELQSCDYEAVLLPMLRGHDQIELRLKNDREQLHSVPSKLAYLNSIPTEKMNPFFIDTVAELNRVNGILSHRIDDIIASEPTRDCVTNAFADVISFSDYMLPDSELIEFLRDDFEKRTSDVICLSETHASTYYTIKVLNELGVGDDSLAVFVFDNHTDVYPKNGEGDKLPDCVTEGNVFLALAVDGCVDTTVFVGSQSREDAVGRANKLMNEVLQSQFPDPKEQVWFQEIGRRLLSEQELATGKSRRDILSEQITKTIDGLVRDGIRNVVFSVDIDFLNSSRIGYTGFQYSPLTVMTRLANAEIDMSIDPDSLTDDEVTLIFVELLVGLEKAIEKRDNTDDEEEVKDFLELEGRRNPITLNREIGTFDPSTLTLGNAGSVINQIVKECKFAGIRVGLKLPGGGTYIGDMVGFEGVDYKGRTAKSARALANRLARVVLK